MLCLKLGNIDNEKIFLVSKYDFKKIKVGEGVEKMTMAFSDNQRLKKSILDSLPELQKTAFVFSMGNDCILVKIRICNNKSLGPLQIAEPVGQRGVERSVERAQLGVGLALGARQGAPLGARQERGRVLDGLRRLRQAGEHAIDKPRGRREACHKIENLKHPHAVSQNMF